LSNSDKAIIKHYSRGQKKKPAPCFDLATFKAAHGVKGIKEGFDREAIFLLSHGFRFFAVDFLGYAWAYKLPPLQDSLTETWTSKGPQASVKCIEPIKGPHPSRFYDLKKYFDFK
jgi:hypothetical protein